MNEAKPLVSVIIACYNHAKYIEQSIRSVLAQTYPNIELLVVDDGSSDDSPLIIQRLQAEYGFDFRVQANQGLSKTLNEAIGRSSGVFIAPFGSDDVMLPERIAIQVAYMADKPEVGICAGDIQLIDGEGRQLAKGAGKRTVFRRLDFADVIMDRVPLPPAATMLLRREALQAAGGFDPSIRLEDLQIWLKVTHAGFTIDCLPQVFAHYRTHGANTYKNYRFMVDNVLRSYALFADHPLYDEARWRFLNGMFLKCAGRDKEFARELLSKIPYSAWSKKTLRGLVRLYLLPLEKG
ncbi:glycosyltransferase [Pseudomonas sp. LPB0260]|uniref:glycosyltransferase family 2 protein n=1 Tax=Pseudomonas sp. LPB0260 TaxID=2614442 RepID=UPI0015C23AAD|nr:glycosyltransferase [Pseudomonas sp. LPB0260]QLC73531.1 glycosyltransferase [Pseudomonas sp. LPB0260]QLC76305.1 glycosyltransferase [Pseudomonas sp. LPB0260]